MQLGESRIGPDLSNVGNRKPPYDADDLYQLLYTGHGGMPSYKFLFEDRAGLGVRPRPGAGHGDLVHVEPGRRIDPLYTPENIDGVDYDSAVGYPGQFPFTRGVHATMYRGKPWTMRMFAGFGTPEDTNRRFKYLLSEGQTGLSTAFDMPTPMGYDPDSPRSPGEVGSAGSLSAPRT